MSTNIQQQLPITVHETRAARLARILALTAGKVATATTFTAAAAREARGEGTRGDVGDAFGSSGGPPLRRPPYGRAQPSGIDSFPTTNIAMNKISRQLLLAIKADLDRLNAAEPNYYDPDHLRAARQHEAVALARRGTVACDPARWLGRTITASGSVAVSRAYKSLARDGLIERRALGFGEGRTTHLRLTEAGEAMARQLAVEASDA